MINAPIEAVVILLTASLLPGRAAGRDAQRLDLRGAVLATVGLTSLVYGISQADPRGWSDPVTLQRRLPACDPPVKQRTPAASFIPWRAVLSRRGLLTPP